MQTTHDVQEMAYLRETQGVEMGRIMRAAAANYAYTEQLKEELAVSEKRRVAFENAHESAALYELRSRVALSEYEADLTTLKYNTHVQEAIDDIETHLANVRSAEMAMVADPRKCQPDLMEPLQDARQTLARIRDEWIAVDKWLVRLRQRTLDSALSDAVYKTPEEWEIKQKELELRLKSEGELVRRLQAKIQDIQGTIRVMCRVRPSRTIEKAGIMSSLDIIGNTGIVLNSHSPEHEFQFDRVFGLHASGDAVFDEAEPMVYRAIEGQCACILAYGQTGSGKTWTMSEVSQRAFQSALHAVEGDINYDIFIDAVEIYNDAIVDLLDDRAPLKIRTGIDGRVGTGAVSEPVNSVEAVHSCLNRAAATRAIGATAANALSSRSHCVITLYVLHHPTEQCGRLFLVDLAGSERILHSKVTGDRLRETQSINKSLSCLGDVIHSLVAGASHIPYRSSKLTHVLQPAFDCDARILMLVTLSSEAEYAGETLTSLRFAEKATRARLL